MDWKSLGFYVLDRFKEPSTYLGIAGVVAAAHLKVDPDSWGQIVQLCMLGASLLGVVLKEGKEVHQVAGGNVYFDDKVVGEWRNRPNA